MAICDFTITSERKKAVDFTAPFMSLGKFVVELILILGIDLKSIWIVEISSAAIEVKKGKGIRKIRFQTMLFHTSLPSKVSTNLPTICEYSNKLEIIYY